MQAVKGTVKASKELIDSVRVLLNFTLSSSTIRKVVKRTARQNRIPVETIARVNRAVREIRKVVTP
jgi:antitoxin component of RelBE/YafQ-DinJ toxin-antitoxin module